MNIFLTYWIIGFLISDFVFAFFFFFFDSLKDQGEGFVIIFIFNLIIWPASDVVLMAAILAGFIKRIGEK